ncbi:hypothetical protein V8E36_006946 [Tilletia maclaganii]
MSDSHAALFSNCNQPSDFPSLATKLLTSCHLIIQPPSSPTTSPSPSPSSSSTLLSSAKTRRFILSDIEFYHSHPTMHHDPFAHAHDSQENSGTWYFHAAGSSGFKEGSYKGLDVTFGDNSSRSGILVRRIAEVVDDDGDLTVKPAVDGPSLVCDAILDALGFSKVRDLVHWLQEHPSGCSLNACDRLSPLRLDFIEPLPTEPLSSSPTAKLSSTSTMPLELGRIWACPRHGLSLKRTKVASSQELRVRLEYIAKPYRFLSARPKNGAINLAYAILLHLRSDLAAPSTSAMNGPIAASRPALSTYTQQVVQIMYPTLSLGAGPAKLDAAAHTRATRTVEGFITYFNHGLQRRQPTAFAGSGMASTREVGELFGSLIDWDGQLPHLSAAAAVTSSQTVQQPSRVLFSPSLPAALQQDTAGPSSSSIPLVTRSPAALPKRKADHSSGPTTQSNASAAYSNETLSSRAARAVRRRT